MTSITKSKINFEKLLAEFDEVDLKNQRITFNTLELQNSSSRISLGKNEQARVLAKQVEQEVEAQLNNDWKVYVKKVDLRNNQLAFDNFNMPVQRSGIDYGHMGLRNFNLQASDFFYSLDSIRGNIGF